MVPAILVYVVASLWTTDSMYNNQIHVVADSVGVVVADLFVLDYFVPIVGVDFLSESLNMNF